MKHPVVSLSTRILVGILGLSRAFGSQDHPLCNALKNDVQRHTFETFPAKYACHHTQEHTICSKYEIDAEKTLFLSDADAGVIDVAPMGSTSSVATTVETDYPQPTTLWLCDSDLPEPEVQGSEAISCKARPINHCCCADFGGARRTEMVGSCNRCSHLRACSYRRNGQRRGRVCDAARGSLFPDAHALRHHQGEGLAAPRPIPGAWSPGVH